MIPLNVLIVEDREDDMHLLLLYLKKGGYQVSWVRVESAQEMREHLKERTWDLILADYNLPRFSGLQALELMKEEGLDLPFILVSGAIGEETAVTAMKAGAHDYLLKDKLARLVPAIERELKEAKERSRLREIELEQRKLEAQLKKAKELAESANQRKSRVLAFVAHEFKNPVRAINTFGEILSKGSIGPLNEKQQDFIHHINLACQHLQDLINDILDIAPIEAGIIELSQQLIHLDSLLDEVRIIVQESAKKKDVKLRFEVQEDIETLYADPKRLRQILINLLSNAIKYTSDHDTVYLKIQCSEDTHYMDFQVEDHGIGISEAEMENLFQDYYRVRNTLTSQKEGLGLGLALTKKLVELHNGTITVKSQPGLGSTFTATLPVLNNACP